MRIPKRPLACLGDALDVRFEAGGKTYLTDLRGFVVCAATDERTIYIVPKGKRDATPVLPEKASRLREKWVWTGADASTSARSRVPVGKDERVGRVLTIGYRSDKDGRMKAYEHKYDVPPTLTRSGDLYRISGGRQRIERRGITG